MCCSWGSIKVGSELVQNYQQFAKELSSLAQRKHAITKMITIVHVILFLAEIIVLPGENNAAWFIESGVWPNTTIPYQLSPALSRTNVNRIKKAMNVWERKTCLNFVERTNEEYFLSIQHHDAACFFTGYQPLDFFHRTGTRTRIQHSKIYEFLVVP